MKLAGDWIDPARLQKEVAQVLVMDRKDRAIEALQNEAPKGKVISGLMQAIIHARTNDVCNSVTAIKMPED